MEWSSFSVILLIVACVAVGSVAGVIRTWSLHSRLYSLEDRLAIVEGNLTREVKARAGQERWKKPDKDLELLSKMQAPPEPTKRMNWWETGLPRQATK